MVKTIYSLWNAGKDILIKNNIESPETDSLLLLCFVLKCDKTHIVINKNEKISNNAYNKYIELINKRASGIPVKYILGNCEFMGIDFKVNENVLIPRPETEILTQRAIEILKGYKNPKVLDLCCGSGCIGISIGKFINNSKITMVDISKEALRISEYNAEKNLNKDSFTILNKDILNDEICGKWDLITANPPYINEKDFKELSKEVLNEPELALVSKGDEYKFYKKIICDYHKNLNDGGYMLLEMGYNQWEYLKNYAEKTALYKSIEIERDLNGINRVLILKK